MIISDLNHVEEVVSEAPSIVGGATTTVTADKLVSKFILDLLDQETVALLKKTKVTVNTVTRKGKSTSAAIKTGSSKSGNVKFASATAIAS